MTEIDLKKYLGKVIKLTDINDKVTEGYFRNLTKAKDSSNNIANITVQIDDNNQIVIEINQIKKIDIIESEEQYTIYQQGLSFWYASKRCLYQFKFQSHTFLIIPYMANSAFACELFLKGILEEEKISYDKVHKLEELFNLLPKHIQSEIEIKTNYKDFNKNLKYCSPVFEDFRYLHENIYKSENISLDFWDKFSTAIFNYADNNLRKGSNINIEF